MEIQEQKDVWLTVANSDLTEGRGRPVILYVCENPVTAARLGRGKSVQGCDADVEKAIAVKVGGRWLIPGLITPESDTDKCTRERNEARSMVINKMRAQGFTDEEISALK